MGSPEDRAWIEREVRVRSIILTPAIAAVWILGLMLATDLGIWDEHQTQIHPSAGVRNPDTYLALNPSA